MRRDIVAFVVFVGLVALAAFVGAGSQPGPWYEALDKPPLNPPNWVFGPVWTVLYVFIAVAGWLVWRAGPESKTPLTLWGVQLVLNGLWSVLFFGWERPGLALIDICVLLAVLILTTAAFWRVRRLAGALFLPYTLWVAFAAYLNAGIWLLNR